MTQPANFSSILDEAPTEVKIPPALPEGTYLCTVQGQPRYDKSTKKGTEYVEFTLRPISAMDDVDETALAEIGGINGKTLRTTYYLTPGAAFLLDRFHEHCGIDLEVPLKRSTRNEQAINSQVLAVVKHRDANDGSGRVFADVERTAPAE